MSIMDASTYTAKGNGSFEETEATSSSGSSSEAAVASLMESNQSLIARTMSGPAAADRMECFIYSFLLYSVFVGILCVLGLVGNLITFLVFWKDPKKTSSSFLFQALSVIDIFLLVVVFPVYYFKPFYDHNTGWYQDFQTFGHPVVLVYILPWAFVAQTATIWVTVLVAINRYIAVCYPYHTARLCTVGQAKIQLIVVLAFALVYNLPKFFEGRLVVHNGTAEARPFITHRIYYIAYGNIAYMIFLMVLPLFSLTIFNVRLIKALSELKKKRSMMQRQRQNQQQDNNVTFVLIIVIIVFSICQSPALINQILWNILARSSRQCGGFQFYFSRISNTLIIANSSVSFLIYVIFNRRFRGVLLGLICRGRRLDDGEASILLRSHTAAQTGVVNEHTTAL